MAKRKLSNRQRSRIQRHQQNHAERARSDAALPPEEQLGAEQEGVVVAHFGTQVEVEGLDATVKRCYLRANLGTIVTGDRVVWRDSDSDGVVVSALPRRSELARPDSFGHLKTVAANIDRLIITAAPSPEPHANLIDRYLVVAETLGIEPLLVFNKADLLEREGAPRELIEALQALYEGLRYPVMRLSAETGDGLDALRNYVRGATSIFAGQSGVGKSSVLQALLPGETIRIGDLSEQMQKGRHTTTNARLYHFPDGGDCIDSPGIREFGLWHMSADEVAAGFREFRPFLGSCRFRDCRHRGDPGCALRDAVAEGTISSARFESYHQIVDSLDAVTVRQP